MSRPLPPGVAHTRRRPDEDRSGRPAYCPPRRDDGPSVGTIVAGVLGMVGAVGLGYVLGATGRDEQEETDRQLRRQTLTERRRQQQVQQQQLANHSYYPAQYGSRQQQQHTEIKEATDHTTAVNTAAPSSVPVKLVSPVHPSQSAAASSSNGIAISAPLPGSASVHAVGGSAGGSHDAEDAALCKICYDAPLDAVLLPCRHQCCCYPCSEQLHECPVCRAPKETAIKIYRS